MTVINEDASFASLSVFAHPNRARSVVQLSTTLFAYAAGWSAMLWLLRVHYVLVLLLAVPVAGFLVRLFIIFHDCGHGSFFRSRRANAWVGGFLGVLTLTPYDAWRRRHAAHHADTGNLESDRSLGSFWLLTAGEYRALGRWDRFRYRVYRHPLVLFGLGAMFHIIIVQRFPERVPPSLRRREWGSVLVTNAGIALLAAAMIALVGWRSFLLVQLPITAVSAAIGIWLFFVQHHFVDAYWKRPPEWSYHAAALHGSTHYDLPRILQWFTGNIGFHHVHHLNSRIPNYRLEECLTRVPRLGEATKLSLRESFRCMSLALWDESRSALIPFSAVYD